MQDRRRSQQVSATYWWRIHGGHRCAILSWFVVKEKRRRKTHQMRSRLKNNNKSRSVFKAPPAFSYNPVWGSRWRWGWPIGGCSGSVRFSSVGFGSGKRSCPFPRPLCAHTDTACSIFNNSNYAPGRCCSSGLKCSTRPIRYTCWLVHFGFLEKAKTYK